ncbi:MAG TPA: hypothetical protein VHB70_19940 [Parafilimonas sp.]|nr:hypothetical protein [Parafilimonas sp.]
MDYNYEQTDFSKSILAGLFAGITATCVNLIFNAIYRNMTSFSPSLIINVSSIIIMSCLILTLAGILFYFFKHYLKSGGTIFRIVFGALTIVAAYYSMQVQRSSSVIISKEFDGLLTGIVLILGAFMVFGIPYLFKHHNIYS